MKEPAVPNARFWFAATERTYLFLECERFYDARAVACALLGVPEVVIQELTTEELRKLPRRVQVRWVGNAARRVPDLRVQVRAISERGTAGRWRDLR